jgi:flagellar basal body-associated protein FliL
MAEESEQTAVESTGGEAPEKSKKGSLVGIILAAVMVIEGIGLYATMKFFGSGADSASGEEALAAAAKQSCDKPEVSIAKMKVPNRVTGKTYIYNIEVAATLNAPDDRPMEEFKAEFEERLQKNENAIRDRINFLIRRADPQFLDEPGLVMIRRQIKVELGKVLKDEKVFDQILLPVWTPLRADM